MPRGESGRIVLEVDPQEKRDLYEALEEEGLTLKGWFLGQARHFLRTRNQSEMFLLVAEPASSYRMREEKEK